MCWMQGRLTQAWGSFRQAGPRVFSAKLFVPWRLTSYILARPMKHDKLDHIIPSSTLFNDYLMDELLLATAVIIKNVEIDAHADSSRPAISSTWMD